MRHTHIDKVEYADKSYKREFTHEHLFEVEAHVHDFAWEGVSRSVTKHFKMFVGSCKITKRIEEVKKLP